MTHKLAVETTIQFVLLSSAFPFTFSFVPEEQLTVYTQGEFQTDHHWFAELPWRWRMSVRVTCCMIMYLEESFADPGFNLSLDTVVFFGLFL